MTHPFFYHTFIDRMIPDLKDKTFLDCACGRGIYGFLVRTVRAPKLLIGIDLSKPYLKQCKFHKVYDDVVLASVSHLPFKNKGIDVVLASEIIEHLPKNAGRKFFDEIDRVCKERAIITTPNIWIMPFTEEPGGHKSRWSLKDLKSRGYKVHGIGARINLRYASAPAVAAIYYVLTPVSYLFPAMAGFLVGVKSFTKNLRSK